MRFEPLRIVFAPAADRQVRVRFEPFKRDAVEELRPDPATLPTAARILNVLAQRQQASEGTPEASRMWHEDMIALGQELRGWLLVGELDKAFDYAREHAQGTEARLRIELSIAPELTEVMRLPWEFLCDRAGNAWVFEHTLYRSVPKLALKPALALPAGEPLRVLAVGSEPASRKAEGALGIEQELALIEQQAAALEAGRIAVTTAPNVTIDELRALVKKHQPHLVHVIAHGQGGATPKLLMRHEEQDTLLVTTQMLTTTLYTNHLRLVVLNGCDTSMVGPTLFQSFAVALSERGVPAVIGMQSQIRDYAARAFAKNLYSTLFESGNLDEALSEAYIAVLNTGRNHIEWALATLHSRAEDGQLFTREVTPQSSMTQGGVSINFGNNNKASGLSFNNIAGGDIVEGAQGAPPTGGQGAGGGVNVDMGQGNTLENSEIDGVAGGSIYRQGGQGAKEPGAGQSSYDPLPGLYKRRDIAKRKLAKLEEEILIKGISTAFATEYERDETKQELERIEAEIKRLGGS